MKCSSHTNSPGTASMPIMETSMASVVSNYNARGLFLAVSVGYLVHGTASFDRASGYSFVVLPGSEVLYKYARPRPPPHSAHHDPRRRPTRYHDHSTDITEISAAVAQLDTSISLTARSHSRSRAAMASISGVWPFNPSSGPDPVMHGYDAGPCAPVR